MVLPLKSKAKLKDRPVVSRGGRQGISKADKLHVSQCTVDRCGQCKAIKLGHKWQQKFLIDPLRPDYGSWLSFRDDADGWRAGCECCFAAGNKGSLAEFESSTYDALQSCNFKKHEANEHHKKAAAAFVLGKQVSDRVGGNVAPPAEFFETLAAQIMKGQSVRSGGRKATQGVWCLLESLRAIDRKFLAEASKISLFRDERKSRLLLRYKAVKKDLSHRTGTLGQQRGFGTGASNITTATVRIIKRLCTPLQGYRCKGKRADPKLNKQLLKHIRRSVFMITVDAASDEVLSAEMLRDRELYGKMCNQKFFKNLRFVLRDKTHASRRTILGWNRAKSSIGNLHGQLTQHKCEPKPISIQMPLACGPGRSEIEPSRHWYAWQAKEVNKHTLLTQLF